MNPPQTLSRPLAKRVAGLADLSAAAPRTDAPPSPSHVIEAAAAASDRGETHYTDRPGIPELRAWVAEYLATRWQVTVDPSAVTITCGSTEARYVALTLLTPPGSQVLCPGDATPIRSPLRLLGAGITQSPAAENISVLYLQPAAPSALALLEQAKATDWWIIWDISFAPAGAFHPAQDSALARRVVTINSLSPSLAGWRLGWMAGSEAALRLRAGKQAITICTTAVSQWAGLAFLQRKSG